MCILCYNVGSVLGYKRKPNDWVVCEAWPHKDSTSWGSKRHHTRLKVECDVTWNLMSGVWATRTNQTFGYYFYAMVLCFCLPGVRCVKTAFMKVFSVKNLLLWTKVIPTMWYAFLNKAYHMVGIHMQYNPCLSTSFQLFKHQLLWNEQLWKV